MKKLLAIFALALMIASGGAYAAGEGTYTTANGTTVEVQASTDTHTRIITITLPDGTVIVRGGNPKTVDTVYNPQSGGDTNINTEVVITVVHEPSSNGGTVIQIVPATVIQPTVITIIGGSMGGGGDIGASASGQAVETKPTSKSDDSSWVEDGVKWEAQPEDSNWIENGTEFNNKNKGKQL